MGYTTEFEGRFRVTPTLKPEHIAYLKEFSETRRMKRDAKIAATFKDPLRKKVGLPVGKQGEYFVGSGDSNPDRPPDKDDTDTDGVGFFNGLGQQRDISVLDNNQPPDSQPGLWCKWVPDKDGTAIEWDGAEKFYHYIEWIEYLIENFLKPWGYVLNGDVGWQGEEEGDTGVISIHDNVVI